MRYALDERFQFGATSVDGLYLRTRSALHAVTAEGDRRWVFDREDPGWPVVGPDTVYVPTGIVDQPYTGGPRSVTAVDAASGDPNWTEELDDVPVGLYGADETGVYGGSHDDAVSPSGEHAFALDVAGGTRRWTVPCGDAFGGIVEGDALYVDASSRVYVFDTSSGDERWHRDLDPGVTDPRLVGDHLVVADDGVHGLALESGEAQWSVPDEDSFDVAGLAVDDASRVYAGGWDGTLRAVDADDGTVAWRHTAGAERVERVRTDGRRTYAVHDGTILAVEGPDPAVRWRVTPDVDGPVEGVYTELAGGVLYATVAVRTESAEWRRLVAYDASSGDELWRSGRLDRVVTTPHDERLYVGVEERLYAVSARKSLPDDA